MKRRTKSKSALGQIFCALLCVASLWAIGVVFNGEWLLTQRISVTLFREPITNILKTIFPYLYIVYAIGIGRSGGKKRNKVYFAFGTMLMLLPLLCYMVNVLLNLIVSQNGAWQTVLMILSFPAMSVQNGFPGVDGATVCLVFGCVCTLCLFTSYIVFQKMQPKYPKGSFRDRGMIN